MSGPHGRMRGRPSDTWPALKPLSSFRSLKRTNKSQHLETSHTKPVISSLIVHTTMHWWLYKSGTTKCCSSIILLFRINHKNLPAGKVGPFRSGYPHYCICWICI
jgi:hypothetical protein